jgi:hypothetical protein
MMLFADEAREELREAAADMRDAIEAARKDERAMIVRWLRGRAIEIAALNSLEASAASVALQGAALRLEDPRPLP